MQQGKDGLAFFEAFLAQKIYLGGGRVPVLLPELQFFEDQIPLPLTSTDKNNTKNHGDLVGCDNSYTLLFCAL
jgi:hypothetical protein